ncbi:MAG: DUF2254 domain-containing protein [Frankiaceae bacterium]
MRPRNYDSLLRLRLRAARERARESLFVLPAIIVVMGIALAELAGYVDRRISADQVPALLRMSRDAAITLLGTVAGATITTTGVVFSIMVVSVQLASGQFSPRVVRNFFRDRLAQAVIGLLVAAFAFSVVTLQQMHAGSGSSRGADVPVVSLNLTALLALVAVFAIVAFLDRSARGLYVGHIAMRVAHESFHTIGHLHDPALRPSAHPVDESELHRREPPVVVRAASDGWVQQIDTAAMLAAVPATSVVRLDTRVGAFLTNGQRLATVWHPRGSAPSPALGHQLRDAVVIGAHRTMQQDVDFGLRQLNDIALRALSPAVNDPTTAIEAILRVGSVLRRLLVAELPAQVREDRQGSVLLAPWELDHAEYVAHAYGQVRLAAANHPAVATAMVRSMRMLLVLVEEAGREQSATALRRELGLLLAGVDRAGLLPEDAEAVHAAAGTSDAQPPSPAR